MTWPSDAEMKRPRLPRGHDLLRDPLLNKGIAFTEAERKALGLQGLLPPQVYGMEEQARSVMDNLRGKSCDMEKYIFLRHLQDRNETLFYRVLIDHLEELMPIVYTPTVGDACQQFEHVFRRPRGVYVSKRDAGCIGEVFGNWPHRDVRVIVATDGERILGLGDLGACGMAITIGKLSLYTACAGIEPTACLPVMLDVGTDNSTLLEDPLYIGLKQRRMKGREYEAFMDEFFEQVGSTFPDAIIHLEDFGNASAFRLLETYRDRACVFVDDIQITATVAMAGLYAALKITGKGLREQKLLFLGAGEAGIGIADIVVHAMMDEGLSEQEALARCWFVDRTGLIVKSRENLPCHKRRYAQDHEYLPDLSSAVRALRPTALIGVSGSTGVFSRAVLESMLERNDRPIVFALSTPTSKAECTAEEGYTWTQ